jgi:HEAT repeat protein
LAVASTLTLEVSRAHGGSYRGPGDTVPPGGGGGGGGGSGPGMPGPSGPGGTGPGTPGGPSAPGGVPTGGSGGRPASPGTGALNSGPDLSTWEFWWGFNKEQYLNLKSHVHAADLSTPDSDAFWNQGSKARETMAPSEETIRVKVVPALRELLANERSNDIVTGALVALAKIGDIRAEDGTSEFETAIARFLADPNQEIAETAAIALGILANEASIPTLQALALDSKAGRALVGSTEVSYRTRAFATYGLGLVGAESSGNATRQRIARILIDVLDQPTSSTRDVQVSAVTALGLVPIDVDPSETPEGALDPTSSRQSQIRFLRALYRDQEVHPMVRAHVPTAMARLLVDAPAELRDSIAEDLLAALERKSKERDEVRMSCVLALGQMGDSDSDAMDVRIRAALAQMMEDGDEQSRNFTNIALGQIGGRSGKGADSERGRRETRVFLLNQLMKGRSQGKTWAALGLGVMENALTREGVTAGSASGTVKEQLRKALADTVRPDNVGAYAIALGIAGDIEARFVLKEKFDHLSEVNARGYLAVGLGLIGARETTADIQKVVRSSKYKPELMRSAAIGLGLLGDKELVPYLCEALLNAKGQSSQAAIATALGYIGDSRSIDPLIAMLKPSKGATDGARGFAAVALGIVSDKELLPWNSKISTNVNYRASTSTLTGESGTGVLDIL